ncbi:hypothetical protein, partial [Pseudomonas savastanoi]|uniref:hypothetical protein n=1 Tax=Pseudomonas savastanoi TaxID=29438 RepID=UPI001EE70844
LFVQNLEVMQVPDGLQGLSILSLLIHENSKRGIYDDCVQSLIVSRGLRENWYTSKVLNSK